jgi:protein-tyrosine phosphatase
MTGRAGHSFPVRSPDPKPGVTDIMLVCHANQCRSPFAEAIARRLADGHELRFVSGGVISGGRPMPEVGRRVGQELGYDFRQHLSREIDIGDFRGFDLVLTMEREQARELVAADPDMWPRIFTLKQFARWLTEHPRPTRAHVGSWLDATAADRSRVTILGHDPYDDVADPIGRPAAAWWAMVDELTPPLLATILGLTARSRRTQ